jgi:hypothetical protein
MLRDPKTTLGLASVKAWTLLDEFKVDQDVKGLGVSNRNPSLLDMCVGMLERGRSPELAMRLLLRYTTERFTGPKEWRKWVDEGRARRFFSDVGGYKFLVAPESLRRMTGVGR